MTEYLKLHRLTTKEQIENHIIELKRNTFVDEVLIFNLSVFNSFSGNNFWNKSLDWNLGAKDPKDFVLIELPPHNKEDLYEVLPKRTENEIERRLKLAEYYKNIAYEQENTYRAIERKGNSNRKLY